MSARCLVRVKTSVRVQSVVLQPMREHADLVGLIDEDHRLPDRVDRRGRRIDADVDRIGEPLVGQLANGGRNGGGKQQRLPPRGHLGHDPPQVVDKAHVEHAVAFVENEDFHVRQVDKALLHEVHQAAGGGDEHVDAGLQGADLRILADAAVNHGSPQPGIAAIGLKALADLDHQFAGGGQDQGADFPPPAAWARVAAQPLQRRQGKGGGLAGSGLGTAQHVAAFQDGRNRGGLDLGGSGVAFPAHGAEQRLGKAEFFKLHYGSFNRD